MDRTPQHLFLRDPKRENSVREIKEEIVIYSDIDEVIHDYRKPFYQELKNRFNIEVDISSIPAEHDLKKPITSRYGVAEKDFEDLIEDVNGFEKWVPTSFAPGLIDFFKRRKKKGDLIIFVTARTSRRGATHIVREALGEDFPIIQCEAYNKKYVVRDKSIFFEDRGDTIQYCAERNPNSVIIAPKWPWNLYLDKYKNDKLKLWEQNEFVENLNNFENTIEDLKKEWK